MKINNKVSGKKLGIVRKNEYKSKQGGWGKENPTDGGVR